MTVAIIDYGSGNLRSAAQAFERAAGEAGGGTIVRVTADPDVVRHADRVVLPGVGAFADCKQGLDALDGMTDALEEAVIRNGRPFLGICVGMQLMAERGREYGTTPGLGWIPGEVVPMAPADPSVKVPHMGWNALDFREPRHPVLAGLAPGAHAYFVHGYHLVCHDQDHVKATVDHGGPVTAVVGRDNLMGTQFHPEKSQAVGLSVIARFLAWTP